MYNGQKIMRKRTHLSVSSPAQISRELHGTDNVCSYNDSRYEHYDD